MKSLKLGIYLHAKLFLLEQETKIEFFHQKWYTPLRHNCFSRTVAIRYSQGRDWNFLQMYKGCCLFCKLCRKHQRSQRRLVWIERPFCWAWIAMSVSGFGLQLILMLRLADRWILRFRWNAGRLLGVDCGFAIQTWLFGLVWLRLTRWWIHQRKLVWIECPFCWAWVAMSASGFGLQLILMLQLTNW